jgi:hypothetical protein
MPHHFLITRTELWGFIKPLAQTYIVHMELSIRQSFQPRRNLGGYMVGTTVGFRVMIMEALAPWSHL